MDHNMNQAVVFTKPVHQLGVSLTAGQLDRQLRSFFEGAGFRMVRSKKESGRDMAAREVIREHYLIYSKASYGDAVVTDDAKAAFGAAFGKDWDAEVADGRIIDNPHLLKTKGITAQGLYLLWNDRFENRKTKKIQDGLIIAWIEELGCYAINAFYPVVEANFYDPATCIDYHVVEFDPAQVSWNRFRKKLLGSTDASKADPESFRGRLYAEYPVEFPGRDNFVHGSAGPLEGFIERIVHEPDLDMATNPVGHYLAGRGISLEAFKRWKSTQTISQLGDLFERTEEKDTAEAIALLDAIRFQRELHTQEGEGISSAVSHGSRLSPPSPGIPLA